MTNSRIFSDSGFLLVCETKEQLESNTVMAERRNIIFFIQLYYFFMFYPKFSWSRAAWQLFDTHWVNDRVGGEIKIKN